MMKKIKLITCLMVFLILLNPHLAKSQKEAQDNDCLTDLNNCRMELTKLKQLLDSLNETADEYRSLYGNCTAVNITKQELVELESNISQLYIEINNQFNALNQKIMYIEAHITQFYFILVIGVSIAVGITFSITIKVLEVLIIPKLKKIYEKRKKSKESQKSHL